MPRRRLRTRAAPPLTAPSAVPTASSTRPRRGTANQSPAAAVIQRSSPEETRQSIHLTVKASPGKLRQATSGNVPKAGVSRQNIVAGKRASRSSRIVREVDSEDEEEEEEEETEEVDAMDVDEDEDDEEDEDDDDDDNVDAEGDDGEDMDAEGEDDDMEDSTPASRIVVSTKPAISVNPTINITKAQDSVEAKEMAIDDDDDDDLSDPDSDLEDEDAEGDDDDEVVAANDEDEEMESDEDLSRGQTPDLSKMTKRQRALVEEGSDGGLMALSNEAQKKKHLTAEEHAMRRTEMARRRKNLSEKRNEEEKRDTIDRLLKKQPPKRGRRALQELTESGQEEEQNEVERANPLFVRYIQNAKGTQLGVPEEWLQAPVGSFFAGDLAPKHQKPFTGRMVEEVV